MNAADTIVAPSTAAGLACRAIVRLSGSRAFEIVRRIAQLPPIERATAVAVSLNLGLGALVAADVYAFPAPRSATGENVVELHIPGSPFLTRRLLDALVAAGARPAEPGEFTARAFFNGKLDLSSAEGVAATIGAANRTELDAARSLLAGELARRLAPTLDALVDLLAAVEADVDFVDEDVSILSPHETRRRIDAVAAPLRQLLNTAPRLERLAHEPRIVLVGRPNAGKSTLLNQLAGHVRAVVSPTAGTTRDALSAHVQVPGGTITLVDLAGLEDSSSDDAIAHQMSAVALDEVARADRVVYVREAGDARPLIDVGRVPDLNITTKIDQSAADAGDAVAVSIASGQGLDALGTALAAIAFPGTAHDASHALALNARHVRELDAALAALDDARAAAGHGPELVASTLRRAVDALGRVLGRVSPDDVLGRIFSSFCIGK